MSTMPAQGFGHRIVQIHPSLRCNLKCAHCYSTSGPEESFALGVEELAGLLTDAFALGYRSVSISGGEPLMYAGLEELLSHARGLGMHTGMVTNGALLNEERLARIGPLLDAVAVSLDGPEELHNSIRGSHQAYSRALRALDLLAASGHRTAVIHTVTRTSLPHLPEIIDTAASHSAQLLRLHPLELFGRAKGTMGGESLTAGQRYRLFLQVLALNALNPEGLLIEADLTLRSLLSNSPHLVYAGRELPDDVRQLADAGNHCAASAVDSLVVESGGTVVPVSFGMNHRYRVCNLAEQGLAEAWPEFEGTRYPEFLAMCRSLLSELEADDDQLVVNWHEALVAHSQETAGNPVLSN